MRIKLINKIILINIMKIDDNLIRDLFLLKKSITKKEEKILLSEYRDIIPLYDIYTHLIYPVSFKEVEDKVLNNHFRFISVPQYNTLKNYKNKLENKKVLNNEEKIFLDKIKYNIKVLDNYDIKMLEKTSINAFYYGSKRLGQSISICRRRSFHPKLIHLSPYYSLMELIKMGQNNNMLKGELSPFDLQDEEMHYKICEKIGDNDISYKEIIENTEYLESDYNIIKFFSIFGSYYVNKNYREYNKLSRTLYPQYVDLGERVNKLFNNSPGLGREYYLYRFIWDDNFIRGLKVGEIFTEEGILSTSRNAFYTPESSEQFGLIMLKISVPKSFNKLLMIETISAFPQEQEVIFPLSTRLELVSKEDNFKYYHVDERLERLINRKYHFKVVGVGDVKKLDNSLVNIKSVDMNTKLLSNSLEKRKKEFVDNLTNDLNLFEMRIKEKKYIFQCYYLEDIDVYKYLFYNKSGPILLIFNLDNEYGLKNAIEIGSELVYNYQGKEFPGMSDLNEGEMLEYIGIISRLFNVTSVKIYPDYKRTKIQNYPDILESNELKYKSSIFYQSFSLRNLVRRLNRTISDEIKADIFHIKYLEKKEINWIELFRKYLESWDDINMFYKFWNDNNELKLPEDLYYEIDIRNYLLMNKKIENEYYDLE